jgi:hypothetical protein
MNASSIWKVESLTSAVNITGGRQDPEATKAVYKISFHFLTLSLVKFHPLFNG